MGPREVPSYYFYGKGFDPTVLHLGHLVFGPYERPLCGRQYNNFRLQESEIEHWASSQSVSGMYATKEGRHPKILFNVANLIDLNISRPQTYEITVEAKVGKKVEINDPKAFFHTKVLEDKNVVNQLLLWLTVARSKKLLKVYRKPKIWLLTGLICLEDAKVCITEGKEPSFGAGVSAQTLAGMGGPALGGAIGLDRNNMQKSDYHVSEPLVWAARWHLLDVDYEQDTEFEMADKSPRRPDFQLFPDVTSKGHFRGQPSHPDSGVFVTTSTTVSEELNFRTPSIDIEEQEYWVEVEKTIGLFEIMQGESEED